MFVWNLPGRSTPMGISKGVDPRKTEVSPAGPLFQPKKFDNFQAASLGPMEEYLMGYGPQGSFSATSMRIESQNRAFTQMGKDMTLVNLVNGKRRGRF